LSGWNAERSRFRAPVHDPSEINLFGVGGSIPNATAVRIAACHHSTTGHGLNDTQIVNVRAR
jgi:hypothetical protein